MVRDAFFSIDSANLKLSKHFKLREFFNSQVAIDNSITNCPPTYKKLGVVLANLQNLADTLEIIRAANDDKLLIVTSGYRCPKLNELVNGNMYSLHKEGAAADITCKDLRHLAETIEWLDLPIKWYANYEKNYIHVQLKNYKL